MKIKGFIKEHKWGILAVIVSMIAGFLFCLSKRGFFTDEAMSFALSNYTTGWVMYETHGWFEPSTWNNFTVNTPFQYVEVWRNQYWDVHPPLYYYLLHTICSFFPGKWSIWFGLVINYAFFFLDLLVIYYILFKLTKNDVISALCVLMFGLNDIILNDLIFLRMYIMSSCFVLIFLALGIRVLNNIGNKLLNLLGLFIIVILGGLTHYQFYMIIASLSLCFAIYLAIKKRWADLIFSFVAVVGAGCLNIFVFFTGTLYHLSFAGSGDRHVGDGLNALLSLFISSDRLEYFISNSWGGLFQMLISLVLVIYLVVYIVKHKNENKQNHINSLIIIASYLIAWTIIMKSSSYLSTRYTTHLEALGIIGNVLGLYTVLKGRLENKFIYLLFIVLICLNLNFSTVIKNINTEPQWDHARRHVDNIAYVLVSDDAIYNDVNSLFSSLRWYLSVGINTPSNTLEFSDEHNVVLYIQNELDTDEYLDFVKSQYTGDKEIILTKVNVNTDYFGVYEITFEDK